MKKNTAIKLLAAGAAITMLAACSAEDPLASGNGDTNGNGSNGSTIVVGSANFPGNVLLGEVYATALEEAGFDVDRNLNIGAREVLYSQVDNCAINVVPEYNQALLAFLDPEFTASGTEEVNAALVEALPAHLEILDSSTAQDNNAIAVRAATADELALTTIGDLGEVSADMYFGGPTEWATRADGYPSIEAGYGVNFIEYKLLDYSGPITLSALEQGDVDAALVFSSVPQIESMNLVVLEDPLNVLGVNNVTPLVCSDALTDEARDLLNRVSALLTTDVLVAMNVAYSLDHRDADEVAREWVSAQDLT